MKWSANPGAEPLTVSSLTAVDPRRKKSLVAGFAESYRRIVQNGSSFQALTIPRSLAIFAESLFLTSPNRSEYNGQETIRQEIAGGAGLSQEHPQAANKEVAEGLTAAGHQGHGKPCGQHQGQGCQETRSGENGRVSNVALASPRSRRAWPLKVCGSVAQRKRPWRRPRRSRRRCSCRSREIVERPASCGAFHLFDSENRLLFS